ncbi:hypothetical protein [Lysinibacillus cavernae]|uniref:hypothetical protein n=1 Tax=Lysinibacillus cavernae TaxID=2666135 RepID=UPI0012D9552C|nr:hypothetical protein [Lysinibacillus cavernae]
MTKPIQQRIHITWGCYNISGELSKTYKIWLTEGQIKKGSFAKHNPKRTLGFM